MALVPASTLGTFLCAHPHPFLTLSCTRTRILTHPLSQAIDHDSAGILKGALMYQTKRVREVMTPLEKCFMLREDTPLNFEVISQVFQLGHSRIPVYSENASRNPPSDPDDIVGLLFTKDLILVDPEEATKVKNVVNFFSRTIHKVS